jgi:hypothetical protein
MGMPLVIGGRFPTSTYYQTQLASCVKQRLCITTSYQKAVILQQNESFVGLHRYAGFS